MFNNNNTETIIENTTPETNLILELNPRTDVADIVNQHLRNNTIQTNIQVEPITRPPTALPTTNIVTENDLTISNTNNRAPTADDLIAVHDYRQRNIIHNHENNRLRNNTTTQTPPDDEDILPALKKVKENIKKNDPNNNNNPDSNKILEEPEKVKEVIDNSVAHLNEITNEVVVDAAQNAINQQEIATIQTRLDNLLQAYTNFTVQYPRISLGITLLGLGGTIYAMYRAGYLRRLINTGIGIAPLQNQVDRYTRDINQYRQELQDSNTVPIRIRRDLLETGFWFSVGITILKVLRIL